MNEQRFFRSIHRVLCFLAWRFRQKAKAEKQAREFKQSSPKRPREVRLDKWVYLLVSPNKPVSVWAVQFGLALLVLAPVAVLTYHVVREWRIDNLYDASLSALGEDDGMTAFRTAHAAHLMKPKSVEILRALRNAAEEVRHARTLEWSLELAEHPTATADDRLRLTRLAIESGDRVQAEKALARHDLQPGGDRMEADSLRLLLTVSRGRSAKPEALVLARNLLALGSTSLEVHQVYWALCMDPVDSALAPEGLSHLCKFADRSDELGRASLRHLLRVPTIDYAERMEYARRLWKFPEPTHSDALLYINAAYHGKSLPLLSLREHLNSGAGLYSDPLDSIGVARSLAWLGRSKDAADYYLVQEDESLSPVQVDFLGSVFANKAGWSERSEVLFSRALEKATSKDLETLRQLMPVHGDPDAIISLLERIEREEGVPPGIRHLLANCYQRLGRADELEALLARTPLPPVDVSPQAADQTCRLKALFGQDLPACRRLAEKLVSQYPATDSYRYSLALCYHLSGRPGEAYVLLSRHLAGEPPVCPSQRLVGALSLAGAGRDAEAARWAPLKERKWLLVPERKMLARIALPKE